MPNQVRVGVGVTGAKQAASDVDKLRDKFTNLQKQGAKGVGIGIGVGAATAGLNLLGKAVGGVTDYIGDSIQAASNLNETMSKSKVIFGDSADAVSSWGDNAAKAFGLSKQAAVEAAASFGNVFKGLGFAADESARMSEKLVELAGDLASFNNIDPTAALEKLRSGLAGEAEPLRSVGVFLNEATVKAKAMQMGLGDAHGELTEGEKILARYQLILEQTKTAQGDFARTADGVANSQRSLNATLEDRQAILGEKLIPLEKTWLDAQINAITGLNFLTDTINMNNLSYDKQLELQAENIAMSFTMTQAEKDQAIAVLQLAMNNYEAHKSFVDVGDSGNRFVKTLKDGKPAAAGLTRDMKDLEQEAKDLDGVISDLSDTIEYDLFGKAIAKGREAELQQQLKDLRKEYDKTESSFRRKIVSGEIAQVRENLFKLHLEEAAKAGPQAAIEFLKKEEKHAGAAKDEIRQLMLKYQALADLQGDLGPIIVVGGAPHGPAKKRAGGGPVAAHEAYTVGEGGEETLVMGNQSGTIIPHGSGGGTGTMIVNHFNISGVSVLTPGSAEALARQLEPVITRAQQRRGQLAGARAF